MTREFYIPAQQGCWPGLVCEYHSTLNAGQLAWIIDGYHDIFGRAWTPETDETLEPDIAAELQEHALNMIRNPTCQSVDCEEYVADAGDYCERCSLLGPPP